MTRKVNKHTYIRARTTFKVHVYSKFLNKYLHNNYIDDNYHYLLQYPIH